jgi:type II secretory ATPase GspE/PulE/Tfp pilus assembly ATPase PilB-like protein
MGVEPYLVASTLELVVAQRLVRLLCPRCQRALDGAERADALRLLPGHDGPVYGPAGCHECNNTGYRGRSGLFESMALDQSLRHAAGLRTPTHELRRLALAAGMTGLRASGLQLVRDGRTSLPEVLRNTHAGS